MMKKVKFIVFAAMSLLLLASCGDKGGKRDSDAKDENPVVEFEGYGFDVIAEVVDADTLDSEGWKYCRACGSGMLPKKVGGNDLTLLRDTLEKLGSVAFASTGKIVPELGAEMTVTALNPDSTAACGSRYNVLSLSLATPKLLVWKSYVAGYRCAAAHGIYRTRFVNYRISDGKILSIPDIMKPGYESSLKDMLREKIKEENVNLLVPVDSIGIPPAFQITTDGVRFVYGVYDIAPYAAGEVTVDFNGYEIEDLLAPGMLNLIYGIPDE